MVPGTSVFPLSETGVLGNFCGRIKGVKYRFALQGGTWVFPGDTGNFGQAWKAARGRQVKDPGSFLLTAWSSLGCGSLPFGT